MLLDLHFVLKAGVKKSNQIADENESASSSFEVRFDAVQSYGGLSSSDAQGAYRLGAYSFVISAAAVAAFHFGWTRYAGKRDITYINEHDPYARLKEICSYPGPARYMVSCPKELAKIAEEKSLTIGESTGPFIPVQKMEEKKETVESAE
uniref:Uncharacterized protein n=1 Tax=Ditylenchus dipsaci TaxID=166011 RepID=A0A915DEE9_9BILA